MHPLNKPIANTQLVGGRGDGVRVWGEIGDLRSYAPCSRTPTTANPHLAHAFLILGDVDLPGWMGDCSGLLKGPDVPTFRARREVMGAIGWP